jgi:hypothetical protein
MADPKDDAAERARALAETALAEYAKGDKQKGDRLAEQAVKTDRATVEEVVKELEQGAKPGGIAATD